MYWYDGEAAEVMELKDLMGSKSLTSTRMALHLDMAPVTYTWHRPRPDGIHDAIPEYAYNSSYIWALTGERRAIRYRFECGMISLKIRMCQLWQKSQDVLVVVVQLKACSSCKAFHYCSKKCL